MYYWLFQRAARNRCALWAWRKWSGLLSLFKHIRRRNWQQAWVWLRWLFRS